MLTQFLQSYIVTYRNGDVFLATVSAIDFVTGKAAADLACRWTRGDPKEQAWDTCTFPRAENAVEGVICLTPAADRLAALESMLGELVAYDEDKIDAPQKSPDGDDYNGLWEIFHPVAIPNQRHYIREP